MSEPEPENSGFDPGLPNSDPTSSYWQCPPHPSLSFHRSPIIPASTTIVIIGSGITGTSIAHNLLDISPDTDIVMLEARTITSGATGRNGGHCKDVSSFKHYKAWRDAWGKEAAQRLVKFRGDHVEIIHEVARKLRQDDDGQNNSTNNDNNDDETHFRRVESVTVVFDPSIFQDLRSNLEEYLHDFPENRPSYSVTEGSVNVEEKYGILNASGAITSPAAALWPYRLVTKLLQRLLCRHERTFHLETNTPVSSIAANPDKSSPHRYAVYTPRGTILAKHIIHATNGYAAHLLPQLRGKIVPVRGQMTALQPPSSTFFPRLGHLRSWSLYYPNGGFDYMTQIPGNEGHVLLGGGVEQAAAQNIIDLNCATDSENNEAALEHLCSVLPRCFRGGVGTTLKQAWTGTMGFTPDGFPIVGRIPRDLSCIEEVDATDNTEEDEAIGRICEDSEWVAAGFNGYGMVQSWQSGRAIAEMILGGPTRQKEIDQWFPREQVECSRERLERMHYGNLHAAFHRNAPSAGQTQPQQPARAKF